jgi:hypothetical protein
VQSRTCSFPASGASVARASAQGHTLFASAHRAVGSCGAGPTCPGCVALLGGVLPSRPSPGRGRSPPPSPPRDTTPQRPRAGVPVARTAPPPSPVRRHGASVPAWCRLRVAPAGPQELSTIHRRCPRAGAAGVSHVLRRRSSCRPRAEDSGGPCHPRLCTAGLVWPAGCVQTRGVRTKRLCEAVPALPGARSPLRPPGYAVDASSIWFVVCTTTTPPWTQDAIRMGGEP